MITTNRWNNTAILSKLPTKPLSRVPRSFILPIATAFLILTGCATNTTSSPSLEILDAAQKGDAETAASLVTSVSPEAAAWALCNAAKLGKLNVVQAMVAHGADINGGIREGIQTARPLAGMRDIMNWVLFHKQRDENGLPLIAAAYAGRLDVVKWLVAHGANIDLRENAIMLMDFQQANRVAVFRPFQVNGGNNAVSAAILAGQSSVVRFLVERGADLSTRVIFISAEIAGIAGFGPGAGFIFADGSIDNGQRLYQSTDGFVHTDLPIRRERELSIRQLMATSTIPEIRALGAKAPASIKEAFLSVCKAGTPEQVAAMIQSGGNVNARADNGITPLMVAAAMNPNPNVVEVLLKAGADLNAPLLAGFTPLMAAASNGNPGIVAVLLSAGADPNVKEEFSGMTPLMVAAQNPNPDVSEVIAALLKAGANLNAKSKDGKTALDWARAKNNSRAMEALSKAGAL